LLPEKIFGRQFVQTGSPSLTVARVIVPSTLPHE
jgi:hypothetical protein